MDERGSPQGLPHGLPPQWSPRAISFSSGGVRILGHVGVLTALLESSALTDVRAWYGCSGGAICALLGILGVSVGWLRDFVEHFPLKVLGQISDDFLTSYMTTWGVNSGEEGIVLLGRYLETWEPGCATWTFADLAAARPGVRLGISATNVSQGSLAWFSLETTPAMRVLDAIRVSCSIPFFFTPWVGPDGDLYCDGAVLEPYPWQHLSTDERAATLVVTCSENSLGGHRGIGRETPTSLTEYLGRLLHIMRPRPPEVPRHWIAVNNRRVSIIDFDLAREERFGLLEEGTAAGRRWLQWQDVVMRSARGTDGTRRSSAHPRTSSPDRPPISAQSLDSPLLSGQTGLPPSLSPRQRTLSQLSSRRRWSL